MRWVALSTLAVAVVAAGAFASARSTGAGGARAYALVDPNDGTPRFVPAHTSGFDAVDAGPFGAGDYCLTPSPGVDVVHTAAVADVEAFYSNGLGFATVRYPTA